LIFGDVPFHIPYERILPFSAYRQVVFRTNFMEWGLKRQVSNTQYLVSISIVHAFEWRLSDFQNLKSQ